MRVAVSTLTVNPVGALIFDANPQNSDMLTYRRRVVSVATLDGSSTVLDSGYTDTDRTISLDITDLGFDEFSALRTICQLNSTVLLFLPDGAYKATPESVTANASAASATFMISGPGAVSSG